jgi:hypothetical protein
VTGIDNRKRLLCPRFIAGNAAGVTSFYKKTFSGRSKVLANYLTLKYIGNIPQ